MKDLAIVLTLLVSIPSFAQVPARTLIDDYVDTPDASYRFKVLTSEVRDDHVSVVIDMVSQRWLTEAEVDRPEWQHWLSLAIPRTVTSNVGLLYIGGGRNGRDPPQGVSQRMADIAVATGTVVAELGMVPNQPLVFHGDGQARVEDDLVGYTWDQFIKTGEARWLARNPMVKSAVRAMDTVTAVMASEEFGGVAVDRFTVAGGSKRGWTTWLTGAIDDRVVGLVPIVIDVLNIEASMRHHFEAYGFWAVAIGNYVDHRIMERFENDRLREAYGLIDPYSYRHRLTMPKLVLNAAGDQFFLPDSSRFYWDELRGENYLRYVPNGDHSLQGTDAMESLVAFHTLIKDGRKPPQLSWQTSSDGTLHAMSSSDPAAVTLWQMTNGAARDFRVETEGRRYERRDVEQGPDGLYRVRVPPPARGWTAYFLEFAYDVGAATPLKLTTEVVIAPDTLPFSGKRLDLPASVTVICTAADARRAHDVARSASQALNDASFAADGIETNVVDERVYLNWEPRGSLYAGGDDVREYLGQRECDGFNYQLESGPEITLPPRVEQTEKIGEGL